MELPMAGNDAISQICLNSGSTSDRKEEKIAVALNCTNLKLGGQALYVLAL